MTPALDAYLRDVGARCGQDNNAVKALQTAALVQIVRWQQEALEKMRARMLMDAPADLSADVASGRTINDVYLIVRTTLARIEQAVEKEKKT